MKTAFILSLLFLGVIVFSFAITFIQFQDYEIKTVVNIDTHAKYQSVIMGNPPNIIFDSLRDTPFNDNVKILTVKIHNDSIGDFFTYSNNPIRFRTLDNWLGSLGIRSYPELVNDN